MSLGHHSGKVVTSVFNACRRWREQLDNAVTRVEVRSGGVVVRGSQQDGRNRRGRLLQHDNFMIEDR